MNYFKDKQTNIVYAYDDQQIKLEFIIERIKTLKKMTKLEIDKHLNPEKYLSDEEKRAQFLSRLSPLNRYQLKITLTESGLLEKLETGINSIEDPALKRRVQITYEDSPKFERTNETVKYMLDLLEISTEKIDELWQSAMTR